VEERDEMEWPMLPKLIPTVISQMATTAKSLKKMAPTGKLIKSRKSYSSVDVYSDIVETAKIQESSMPLTHNKMNYAEALKV
jgi:hypothetical protein